MARFRHVTPHAEGPPGDRTGPRSWQRCGSGVAARRERRGLRLPLVAGLLHDRRHGRVGDEALPALLVPVEDHPDAVVLAGVAEDEGALRAVLLALVGAGVGEDVE